MVHSSKQPAAWSGQSGYCRDIKQMRTVGSRLNLLCVIDLFIWMAVPVLTHLAGASSGTMKTGPL